MTRLTEAIAADIYTLLEITSITRSKSEIDAEEYQKSLNSLRVALDNQNKENKSFKIKIQEMESRLHSGNCTNISCNTPDYLYLTPRIIEER